MSKRLLKIFSVFTMVFIMVTGSLTSMASDVYMPEMDLSLLNTVAHPNAGENVETRLERHERLIAEGYVLEDIQVSNKSRNLYITGPDGRLYETRVATSKYTYPTETTVTYGEDYLNVFVDSIFTRIIEVAVGFVDYVGWIPAALGINADSVANFLSNGRVTHICDTALFYYDIEAKLAGTNRYYFVASSERFEMAVTAVSSGFTQLGSPVQETVSGFEASQSANYGNESALSEIAVEYLATGGPDHSYVYFEGYDVIDYVELH